MKNKIGLKELSDKDLRERWDAEKMQLVKMKINHAVSPLENPNLIRVTRKNIARINTEITKRELNPVSSTNEEK